MIEIRVIDENGKMQYLPYIFNSGLKATDTVYSDRLYQWNSKKHDMLCMKHFGNTGQYWGNRDPEKIELFLRDYCNDSSIVLCRIEEHENKSNGYPLWRIDYLRKQKSQKKQRHGNQ